MFAGLALGIALAFVPVGNAVAAADDEAPTAPVDTEPPTAPHRGAVGDQCQPVLDLWARPAGTGDGLAEPWQSYTTLVRGASYRVTDADIAGLLAAGHTEDEVFELTAAAAIGAALRSFDAGQRALGNDPG